MIYAQNHTTGQHITSTHPVCTNWLTSARLNSRRLLRASGSVDAGSWNHIGNYVVVEHGSATQCHKGLLQDGVGTMSLRSLTY